MSTQPEAQILADKIADATCLLRSASLELRRLHAANVELLEALKLFMSAGVGNSTDFAKQMSALDAANEAIAKHGSTT